MAIIARTCLRPIGNSTQGLDDSLPLYPCRGVLEDRTNLTLEDAYSRASEMNWFYSELTMLFAQRQNYGHYRG